MLTQVTENRISQDILDNIRDEANDKIDHVLEQLGIDVDESLGYSDEIRCSCPVHGGDNPTAFSYSTRFKRWRCFTNNCHDGKADIFGLVEAILSKKHDRVIGFVEAVEWVAQVLGIPFSRKNPLQKPDDTEIIRMVRQAKAVKRIRETRNQVSENTNFEPFPLERINGKVKPSWYFLEQGFTEDILKKYNVGYCDDSRKPMYLRSYAPVLDDSGKTVIGVTGRIRYEKCELCGCFHQQGKGCPTDNAAVRNYPKWQHYGFNSGTVLYNSWNANTHVRNSKVAIILEGPKNVWWLEQHNVHNSMCIFGLNFTDIHLKKLVQMGTLILVTALDNDERGLTALERLTEKTSDYFRIFNIKHLLKEGEDIAETNSERMVKDMVPYLKSLEC